MSAENKDTKDAETEEVLGDTAPVLEAAQIAPLDSEPVDPFEDSISLTATFPLSLSQLRKEVAEAVSASEDDIELAYSCKAPESPVGEKNQATVFVRVQGTKVTKKALEGVLSKHVPEDAPAAPSASARPALEGDVAALADRLRGGDKTLSTEELCSVLGALLG